ncbi:LPXTG cell wall anchor domain-containing protein [Staphylococcus epidermidis]|nr:LPXTG cell wall anchor domain-containing protein [Staphylococcus epidermidis]
MKTTKILGATTLAGALLFTGVGHVNAAENLSESQAEDSVKNFVSNNNDYQTKGDTKFISTKDEWSDSPIDNSYNIAFGEERNQSPSFLYVKKDTGDIYDHDGNLVQKGSANSEDTTQNNNQSSQATDNTVNTQNNEQQQSQATDNAKAENNTQALPETGEESSNTTLVTMIASVILAAGSLLAFRRTSKSNK